VEGGGDEHAVDAQSFKLPDLPGTGDASPREQNHVREKGARLGRQSAVGAAAGSDPAEIQEDGLPQSQAPDPGQDPRRGQSIQIRTPRQDPPPAAVQAENDPVRVRRGRYFLQSSQRLQGL